MPMRKRLQAFTSLIFAFCLLVVAISAMSSATAFAASSAAWDQIRATLYPDQELLDGRGIVSLMAPVRPPDMRVVPISISAQLPDGGDIASVSVLIDNNPTPVAAIYKFAPGRDRVSVTAHFRVDRQSDVRAVVEANDGRRYMVSRLIKFAGGQSSCSAPPTGDPEEIAANMGKMDLQSVSSDEAATSVLRQLRLTLSHPNHTGMVMDQITLLYTPLNMVSGITVSKNGTPVLSVEGSIALSQDPLIAFDVPRSDGDVFTVSFADTDGNSWQRDIHVGPGS